MNDAGKYLVRGSLVLLIIVLGLSGATRALAQPLDQVHPTHEWVNFYGTNTTLDGEPVPAGTLISAYDPQGTLCGQATVHTPGHYGLLACYRDDPNTPEDEGADPGDAITFKMNGQGAAQHGPDSARWSGNGDLMQVELSAGAAPFQGGTLRGTVFLDADGDEGYDPGEAPVTDVTVTAISADGFEIPLYSGADGTFGFVGMRSGYWTLQVTVPAGYAASGPTEHTEIWIGEGSWVVLDKNFGLTGGPPSLLPVAGGGRSEALSDVLWLLAVGSLLAGLGLGLQLSTRRRSS